VLFYSYPKRQPRTTFNAVAVLERRASGITKLWSVDCGGAYVGFFPDTGVYDINHTGRPKIVVDCEGTTVCPNFFGVYEYRNGHIEPVPADFQPLMTCRVKLQDLNHDGKTEIINYPRGYGELPQIFAWNGEKYAAAAEEFPQFWRQYASSNFHPLPYSQPPPSLCFG
jgi:hypothetical protein